MDNCTGIISYPNNNMFSVYPNPLTYYTIVSFNNSIKLINAEVHIYDMSGKEAIVITNINGYSIKVERKDLCRGLYFMRILNNNSFIGSSKLIIE